MVINRTTRKTTDELRSLAIPVLLLLVAAVVGYVVMDHYYETGSARLIRAYHRVAHIGVSK